MRFNRTFFSGLLHFILLVLVIAIGGYVRFTALDWDDFKHYHPDERYISWVATTIELPKDLKTALDPHASPLNPYYWPPNAESKGIVVPQDQPRKFAYGHLPLYLGVMATRLIEKISPSVIQYFPENSFFTQAVLNTAERSEYHHLTAVARALTALVDTGTILLVYYLGKQVWDRNIGLVGAAFFAVTVMQIQIAHFFIVDSYLTFFTTASILFMVISARTLNPKWNYLAAIFIGLAFGCKVVAGLLLIPLLMAVTTSTRPTDQSWVLMNAIFFFFAAILVANPYAFIDFSCQANTPSFWVFKFEVPSVDLKSCYLSNLFKQQKMVSGSLSYPFTRQYNSTVPVVYYLETLLRWGMGPALGLISILGLGWASFVSIGKKSKAYSDYQILLLWVFPYFLVISLAQVKFMRYLLPMAPFMILFGAALIWQIPSKLGRNLIITVAIAVTGLYAFAFINLYSQPHPMKIASEWLEDHIKSQTVVVGEKWDEPLLSQDIDVIDWLSPSGEKDNQQKIERNLKLLSEANFYTVNSSRIYLALVQNREEFPLSSQFHPLLFNGDLGFVIVYATGRGPNLLDQLFWPERFEVFGLTPPDEIAAMIDSPFTLGRADESFLVYDQPLVMIFVNSEHLSPEEMLDAFDLSP